jgi:riboflavin kinase
MILSGRVVAGIGNFSYWIEKLKRYYKKKTGMVLYPGTLNIELKEPYHIPRQVIRLEKEEYGGAVSVNIVPCRIFGRKAFILRPDPVESGESRIGRKKNIIEIACDVRLREKYGLNDGDVVEVEVEEDYS